MPNMKMRDVKVGEAIMYNGEVWVIFDRHEQTRGNLRTYWQIKLKHLDRGNVVEQRFSPDDNVEKVMLNRQEYDYYYPEDDMFVCMDPKSYEQVFVSKKLVPEAQHGYMVPNMKISLLKIEERVVQVELPQIIEGSSPPACRSVSRASVVLPLAARTHPRSHKAWASFGFAFIFFRKSSSVGRSFA
jgi:elongation factor P